MLGHEHILSWLKFFLSYFKDFEYVFTVPIIFLKIPFEITGSRKYCGTLSIEMLLVTNLQTPHESAYHMQYFTRFKFFSNASYVTDIFVTNVFR